jgi:transposase
MAIVTPLSSAAKRAEEVAPQESTGVCVYVGLDVHKETLVLAARKGNERVWLAEATFIVADGLDKLLKFLKKLAKHGELRCCYEASGAGFVLQRQLTDWGFHCEVIASSLIPSKPGDKRKCDRLDAQRLADYYRSGLLTPIAVPSPELEAARGVVRCRQAMRAKVTQSKHQLTKFLQTKGLAYREGTSWTGKHRIWLSRLKFSDALDKFTFDQYLSMLEYLERRLEELDQKLEELANTKPFQGSVSTLRSFRGVQTLTAMVLVTELGDVRRFPTPRHAMSYVGLTPSVSQSGDSRSKSSCITKAGSARCRHVLVQAAWNYIRRPQLSRELKERQKDCPAWLVEQSWKAQQRLYDRFKHLANTTGRHKAIVAIARELTGFLVAALSRATSN